VEAVTTLPCILGEYVKGQVVQREILHAVSHASLVLADISGHSPNVYIELGPHALRMCQSFSCAKARRHAPHSCCATSRCGITPRMPNCWAGSFESPTHTVARY